MGPSWRQVGQLSAILAATWPILAPRWAPTDLQIEPQTRPKSHLGASWRQEGRPGTPNHPWSSNFQGFDPNFDSIFDPIFEHIFIIFLRFLLQFPAAGLARWRLCARSALDIRRPPATGVTRLSVSRIFLNLSSRHPPTRARTL